MHWSHHVNATPLPMQHAIYNTGTWNSHWATKSKIAIQYSIMPNDYHKIVVEIVCSSCFLKIVPIPWSLSTNADSNLVCKLFGFVVFLRVFLCACINTNGLKSVGNVKLIVTHILLPIFDHAWIASYEPSAIYSQ